MDIAKCVMEYQSAFEGGIGPPRRRTPREKAAIQFRARLADKAMTQYGSKRRTWDYRCGARTRKGAQCQRRCVRGRIRCINHGGLSTGPKGRKK